MAGPLNSNDIPTSTIKEQITDTPTNSDNTIMDDTSMIMDGSGLMGGPVTIVEGIESKIKVNRVWTDIPRES